MEKVSMSHLISFSRYQTKCGQLIEYNVKQFFFKNHTGDKAGRLVFILDKSFILDKRKVTCSLVSIYFDSPRLRHTIKTNCTEL